MERVSIEELKLPDEIALTNSFHVFCIDEIQPILKEALIRKHPTAAYWDVQNRTFLLFDEALNLLDALTIDDIDQLKEGDRCLTS
ncbi:MAG: hypothetical protein GXP46_01700 [Deferribacteres bacterium]|nr:hypothetical protein [Deferribacteres bacterium]